MAWVAVDKNGRELTASYNFNNKDTEHLKNITDLIVVLLKGSIEKLIGRKLTWEDEPVELKEKE